MAVCRYAKYYLDGTVQKRTLLKVFGIRIDIIVQSLVSNIFEYLYLYEFLTWEIVERSFESLALFPSQARKFDIIPTLTAIGSGVGIFGVVGYAWLIPAMIICLWNTLYTNYYNSFLKYFFQATVVCDLVLLYLLPKREFYKNMKFKYTDTQVQVSSMMHMNWTSNLISVVTWNQFEQKVAAETHLTITAQPDINGI